MSQVITFQRLHRIVTAWKINWIVWLILLFNLHLPCRPIQANSILTIYLPKIHVNDIFLPPSLPSSLQFYAYIVHLILAICRTCHNIEEMFDNTELHFSTPVAQSAIFVSFTTLSIEKWQLKTPISCSILLHSIDTTSCFAFAKYVQIHPSPLSCNSHYMFWPN
jgi:hypothetical protein